ncbi:hypothetical protein K3495_g15649 [Podosphaera aphanis]|nr:hypothetical protein K3495_g15649 [Podosphaera aphanis]
MSNSEPQDWLTCEVDFYDFLGIREEECSDAELRRAYRETALKYHPEMGTEVDAGKYELSRAAYVVLGHPILKAEYDGNRAALLNYQRREKELIEIRWRQIKEKEARDKEARELEARVREAREGGSFGSKRPQYGKGQAFFRKNQKMAERSILKTLNTILSMR